MLLVARQPAMAGAVALGRRRAASNSPAKIAAATRLPAPRGPTKRYACTGAVVAASSNAVARGLPDHLRPHRTRLSSASIGVRSSSRSCSARSMRAETSSIDPSPSITAHRFGIRTGERTEAVTDSVDGTPPTRLRDDRVDHRGGHRRRCRALRATARGRRGGRPSRSRAPVRDRRDRGPVRTLDRQARSRRIDHRRRRGPRPARVR